MKPADHPDFFRVPAPAGRSRESSIVLDRLGRFFHEGERVEHAGLAGGFARWLRRHPHDRRFILSNGYDWCYLTVEDTPYFVEAVWEDDTRLYVRLSDGSEEALMADTMWIGQDEVLRTGVKQGQFDARFSRGAQLQLEPWLADGDPICLKVGGRRVPLRMKAPPVSGAPASR